MHCRVLAYSQYVQGLKLQEEEPGCEQCTQNRLLLEKLWQVACTAGCHHFSCSCTHAALQARTIFKLHGGSGCANTDSESAQSLHRGHVRIS